MPVHPGRLVDPPQGVESLGAEHAHLVVAHVGNLRGVQIARLVAGPVGQLTELGMADVLQQGQQRLAEVQPPGFPPLLTAGLEQA